MNMGKTKITDITKLAEMRGSGKSLREIGNYFDVSPEAIRLALQNIEKKKRQSSKLAQLLFSSIDGGNKEIQKPSKNISQIIDDWMLILQAAKKAALLEDEMTFLKERVTRLENRINQLNNTVFEEHSDPNQSP
jgi:hypothetical protein